MEQKIVMEKTVMERTAMKKAVMVKTVMVKTVSIYFGLNIFHLMQTMLLFCVFYLQF